MKNNNLIYFLPCKPGSVYANITDECINDCLFCVKRDGPVFYGSDLSLSNHYPKSSEIITSLKSLSAWNDIQEVVFCGMGEPMLRYQCVMDVCNGIRAIRNDVKLRLDTSGLFWADTKRLDFLDCMDILNVSLNAENAEKYAELCEPKIGNSFEVLMDFLTAIKREEDRHAKQKLLFPEVRLSIVDTSEKEFVPVSGKTRYKNGEVPVPDLEKCKKIADGFGWSLIVKRLFRDSREEIWNNQTYKDQCARGISSEICVECTYRH